MPISFDLEKLRSENSCINYLETGLNDPREYNISSTLALKCNFNKIFSIEIREDWVNLGKEFMKNDIDSGRFYIIHDDSVRLEKYLSLLGTEKTLFFLDAHVDSKDIKNFQKRCPIFEELMAIKTLERKDNVICIDDMRIMRTNYPWDETSYSNISYEKNIKELILSINPNYKFIYLNGHVPDDVLVAFI